MLFYSNGTYVGRNILASGYPAFHGFDLKVCITFFTDSFLTREKITFYKRVNFNAWKIYFILLQLILIKLINF